MEERIMKKNIIKATLVFLSALTMLLGCTEMIDPEEVTVRPDKQTHSYKLTVSAKKSDGALTKGLAIGDEGTEVTTTSLKSIWKANEQVLVYLGTTKVGTLEVETIDPSDNTKATLSGDISVSDINNISSSTFTLITPRETWSYNGQKGKLLIDDDATSSIEKLYHYTMASATVTSTEGNTITIADANFVNQQSIYRMSFRYGSGESKVNINAKTVTISSLGKLVQDCSIGSEKVMGDITVTPDSPTTDVLFAAIRTEDSSSDDLNLKFTIIDQEGVTYTVNKSIPAAKKDNGTFISMKNTTADRMDAKFASYTMQQYTYPW